MNLETVPRGGDPRVIRRTEEHTTQTKSADWPLHGREQLLSLTVYCGHTKMGVRLHKLDSLIFKMYPSMDLFLYFSAKKSKTLSWANTIILNFKIRLFTL